MEPLPLTAQPGEAAAGPREDAPAAQAAAGQRLQPRESPSAGNPEPRIGVLEARASTAFAAARGTRWLPARTGSAEQSNTSILYGDALILKLFRRLQTGENPDVEIGRFLTEVAGFKHIAAFLGEISITPSSGEKTTVAMLQGLVKNEGDGWEWMLGELERYFEESASQQVSESASQHEEQSRFLAAAGNDRKKSKNNDESILAAGLLGRRTAEMHLALATPTSDPAFRAEPFTGEDLTRDILRMEEQAASAFGALRARLATLPEDTADDAAAVLARRRELLARARSLGSGEAAGMRIRIHGDYHLGQTLRVASEGGGDFVILDFEGEPARQLAERRRKQSPLKDVAGMIRSFSYAAWFGMDRYRVLHKDEREETLLRRAQEWENAAREAFLSAYWEAMAARGELLPAREQAEVLLSAYVLEKSLYELLYELNNRPQWVRIPLAGILGL